MAKITYYVSASSSAEHEIDLTVSRDNGERQLCNRWPKEDQLRDAIGLAFIKALSSRYDYGNSNVKVVIEASICSIDNPTVTI